MRTFTFPLAEYYPQLANNGADPRVTVYLQDDIEEGDCKGVLRPTSRPALIICPGGGYHHVGKREAEPVALAFMPLGFNCFILDYSVAPHRYPQALRELTALTDLVCRNAQDWNIDPAKIVICGFSAGGHLAASYCTLGDRPEITDFLAPRPIAAAILGYPVISADAEIYHGGTFRNLLGVSEISRDQTETYSLELHVSKALTPPTFLWHTASDRSVPVANTLRYGEALGAEGIPFEMHIFPAGRHGMGTADRQGVHDYTEPENQYASHWVDLAKGWLKQFIL